MSKLDNNAALANKRYFLPDIADIIFFFVIWLILYLKENMLLADGSTGWHIVTGNYILQHHNIPHTDIISYTFPNKPWVAYEWFSDVIMAILVKIGGLNLLYVSTSIVIAYLILLLYLACRENKSNFIFATFITMIGAFLSAIHWLARPHLFTFFGVFIFVTQLQKYYRGLLSRKKLLLYLSLYMLIWVNSHPAFLLGFIIIGIYLFSVIIELVFLKNNANARDKKIGKKEQIATFFYALILTSVTSLVTPYGIQLYSYIGHYLFKTNAVIAATDEFQSPVFHGAWQPGILELLFALSIMGLIITRSKIALPDLLTYLLFAHLSLSAQRNMALFVIATLPIIARIYASTKFDSPSGEIYSKLRKNWQSLIISLEKFNNGFTQNEKLCSYHFLPFLVSLFLIVVACSGGKVFGHSLIDADFCKSTKPSKNLALVKELKLAPDHGLSFDNWGGLIRFKINYPVFIDDRADFYGQDFYMEYWKIFGTSLGWQDILKKHQINWILMPKNCRLIEELKADSNWQVKGEDDGSTLVVRKSISAEH